MRHLITCSSLLVNATSKFGRNPLHEADNGYVDVVELLLNSGADDSKKTVAGRTALDWAVSSSHTAVVELLLGRRPDTGFDSRMRAQAAQSASVMLRVNRRYTPVRAGPVLAACKAGDFDLRELSAALQSDGLTSEVDDVRIRAYAHAARVTTPFAYLLQRQRTPLHLAANLGNLEAVKMLLEAGAVVHVVDAVSLLDGFRPRRPFGCATHRRALCCRMV